MDLTFKLKCPCGSSYLVKSSISTDKIVCPNCGKESANSPKLISILKTAREIEAGNVFSNEESVQVLSLSEEMNYL